MADIQYDPACVDCRRDAGKDIAGTTWQCNVHVRAERDWLRAKLANVMVEWEHDVEVLTKERNAALTLAEQRGAAYDLMLREVEAVDKGAAAWKRMADELEAERDRLRERLDQFEAYAITVKSALDDRADRDALRTALVLCVDVLPGLEVRNWPPGFAMKKAALDAARAALAASEGGER
jgi:hypothetical protein